MQCPLCVLGPLRVLSGDITLSLRKDGDSSTTSLDSVKHSLVLLCVQAVFLLLSISPISAANPRPPREKAQYFTPQRSQKM